MSQTKIRTYINIASFKLNRISLFNQSKFNPSLNNMLTKNNNIDVTSGENIQKINPLTKKHKIIKKHNILKKIDFNLNSNKADDLNKSKNTNNELSTTNKKINIFKSKKVHLPILIYNNYNKMFQNINNSKRSNSNRINLQKKINIKNSTSFTFNSFKPKNQLINANHYINNATKILKPNYTDKEIQTTEDYKTLNNDSKKANSIYKINIKSKINIIEKTEEDSSDDFEYKKEIEKIITNKPDIKNFSDIAYLINNNKKIKINKYNNFILLKSLYRLKNFNTDKFYKTENNMKITPIKNKKFEKNFYYKINNNKSKNNLSQRQPRLIDFKKNQKRIIPKTYIYNLLNLSNETKIQNSMRTGNK